MKSVEKAANVLVKECMQRLPKIIDASVGSWTTASLFVVKNANALVHAFPSFVTVADPHVTSLTEQKFDLWRTEWSTFVQTPDAEGKVNLLVRGNIKAYEEGSCTPAFLQDVKLTGAWLEDTTTFVHAGS